MKVRPRAHPAIDFGHLSSSAKNFEEGAEVESVHFFLFLYSGLCLEINHYQGKGSLNMSDRVVSNQRDREIESSIILGGLWDLERGEECLRGVSSTTS